MRTFTAVGIHDDFSTGQTCVRGGTALNKSAGGIYEDFRIFIKRKILKHGPQDIGDDLTSESIEIFILGMLNGNHDGLNTHGFSILILNGHLRLAVGVDALDSSVRANFVEPFANLMSKFQRQRNKAFCLVGGISVNRTLVSGADGGIP